MYMIYKCTCAICNTHKSNMATGNAIKKTLRPIHFQDFRLKLRTSYWSVTLIKINGREYYDVL